MHTRSEELDRSLNSCKKSLKVGQEPNGKIWKQETLRIGESLHDSGFSQMHLGMMLQIDELSYIKIKTHMNKKKNP